MDIAFSIAPIFILIFLMTKKNGHSGAWERRFNPNRKKRFPVSSCPSQVIEMEDWDTITELAEKAVAESLK